MKQNFNVDHCLRSVASEEKAGKINFLRRALGLQWCIQTDNFKFSTSVQERPHTRRCILSVVSSLYDPLGFVAPFTMPTKLLLQGLYRRHLGWDETIPHSFSKLWFGWLEDLHKVEEF